MVLCLAVGEANCAVFAVSNDFQPLEKDLESPGKGVRSLDADLVLVVNPDSSYFQEQADRNQAAN